MDLLSFNGQIHVEGFIGWISDVETFFDHMNIKKSRKVKLMALRLKGGTSAWWDHTTLKRVRFRKIQSGFGVK